ncbi:hypothetical protein HDV00_001461 [Rhizophlyctis rosea]|nr:hypothetical protein HDV00_001461 [Rhizophlyctis rosea]
MTSTYVSSQVSTIYEAQTRAAITRVLYDVVKPEGLLSNVEAREDQPSLNRKLDDPAVLVETSKLLKHSGTFTKAWQQAGETGDGVSFVRQAQKGFQMVSGLECDYLGHVDILSIPPTTFASRLQQHQKIEILNPAPAPLSTPDTFIPTRTHPVPGPQTVHSPQTPAPLEKKLSESAACPYEATQFVLGEITGNSKLLAGKLCQLERDVTYKTAEHNMKENQKRTALDVVALAILASPAAHTITLGNFLAQNQVALPNLYKLYDVGRLIWIENQESFVDTIHDMLVTLERVVRVQEEKKDDPATDLAKEVNGTIDRLSNLGVDGDTIARIVEGIVRRQGLDRDDERRKKHRENAAEYDRQVELRKELEREQKVVEGGDASTNSSLAASSSIGSGRPALAAT